MPVRAISKIHVLVAATPHDVQAEGISTAVSSRSDMWLVAGPVIPLADVPAVLEAIPRSTPCAVLVVGQDVDIERLAHQWQASWRGLVVASVDVIKTTVRIETRDATLDLDSLLNSVSELVVRSDHTQQPEPAARFLLHAVASVRRTVAPTVDYAGASPLLKAAMTWVHVVLRNAIPAPGAPGGSEVPGVTLTAAALAGTMDARPSLGAPILSADVTAADAALKGALADGAASVGDAPLEPLAAALRAFGLTPIEFRVLLLAVAPEIDMRYQRCMALLLDDPGRRVGTLGLFAALIGEPCDIRRALSRSANLMRWRLVDLPTATLRGADEPARSDPAIAAWLLGERTALEHDIRVRRLVRWSAWPGAGLFPHDTDRAAGVVARLQRRRWPGNGEERPLQPQAPAEAPVGPDARADVQWTVFAGEDTSAWRALIELGAQVRYTDPIRIDVARLADLDTAEIEESGIRLGRLAHLTYRPLLVDAWLSDPTRLDDDALHLLLAAIGTTGVSAGVLSPQPERIVGMLSSDASVRIEQFRLDTPARTAACRAAARAIDVSLSERGVAGLAEHYPLPIDGLAQAAQIALAQQRSTDDEEQRREGFRRACRDIAAQGVSHLADRIDPAFGLADIVLPPDRARQLEEIVDNVRLASKVLDEWRFREQLPYGRGVTALFHGASGTGKTMAANGIAHALGIQLLRIDLSRVVSKYIGDTEKNIDRVFLDARRSGAAILIDEADALLGRRSEVKDAHDRYANIEVAYLLQRMEAFEGVAILTTNMRQNLDSAFLRRLRFIVEFPRPDAQAREQIWRRCLPPQAHALDDAAFHRLGRRIDLTGGHIRQITLRAAFAAVASHSKISLAHIQHASRAEFAKLGMPGVDLVSERRQAA